MWKRLLRISGYRSAEVQKCRSSEVTLRNFLFFIKTSVLLLYCSSALFLFVSCAPKHVELPSYEGIPIENAISELKSIQSIEAVLSVEYEKNANADANADGYVMSGDALLSLSENKLNLRLYYLGFPAGEVKEDNGIVKSNPKLDRNKSAILVDGLKNSFLWWNIKDYTMQEKEDIYVLKNSYRKILISKKTLLPIQQTIELNDGEVLNIFYDAPASQPLNLSTSALWYNSRLKIEFKNYIVKIKVKSYTVVR